MSGSLNEATLIGNLARDPEIRTLNSGDRVANLRVVTSESWKDRASGERKERAEFHAVVIFNEHLIKVAENYLKKGSTVFLRGQITTRKYEQAGVEKYTTEIVLQKFRGELTMLGGGARSDADERPTRGSTSGQARARDDDGFGDRDIPFASREGIW